MNVDELTEALGVTRDDVDKFVRAGMPEIDPGVFDEGEVEKWLRANGYAVLDESQIVKMPSEVAAHFGVSVQTVYYWLGRPGFPGKRGNFPLPDIADWWASTKENRYGSKTKDQSGKTARDQIAELKLAELRKEVIPIEIARDILVHAHEAAAAELRMIPGEIESMLPSELHTDIVSEIRNVSRNRVNSAMRSLEESIRTWDPELEDTDGGDEGLNGQDDIE